jgi:hypothetical protein
MSGATERLIMKKLMLTAIVGMLLVSANPSMAGDWSVNVSFGFTPRVCAPPPPRIVYAPAPVFYAPPPVVCAPRVVYARPVYYAPAPVIVYSKHGHGYGRGHRGWCR